MHDPISRLHRHDPGRELADRQCRDDVCPERPLLDPCRLRPDGAERRSDGRPGAWRHQGARSRQDANIAHARKSPGSRSGFIVPDIVDGRVGPVSIVAMVASNRIAQPTPVGSSGAASLPISCTASIWLAICAGQCVAVLEVVGDADAVGGGEGPVGAKGAKAEQPVESRQMPMPLAGAFKRFAAAGFPDAAFLTR